jgi:hypothetical protein
VNCLPFPASRRLRQFLSQRYSLFHPTIFGIDNPDRAATTSGHVTI